jgi:hypothetical protein
MRVRVDDPEDAADLIQHLLRARFHVVRTGERLLAVAVRDPVSYEAARIVLDEHLTAWRQGRNGAKAVLVD